MWTAGTIDMSSRRRIRAFCEFDALQATRERTARGLWMADNEAGWRMSLAKLAALVEAG
jgi:hypothetical protein